MCCCPYDQFVLVGLDPLPRLLQVIALAALNLSRHNRLPLVDLLDDVKNHDARFVVCKRAGLEAIKGPRNCLGTLIRS